MKKVLLSVLLFVICLTLSSCTDQKKGDKTVTMIHWGDVHEISLMRDVIKSMKTEKNIDVKQFRANSGETYMEKVLTQFAAGDAPDVIFTEVNNFKEFADKGVLVDLMPYIKRDGLDMNDYYRQIIERFTIDGKLYVLPRDIAPICVIYYNKKFFDQAGIPYPKSDWNRAKFLDTAEKLVKKDASGRTIRYGFVDEWSIWESWAAANGGSLVDNVRDPKRCTMDSKAVIDAVQFRADMINRYKVMPSPSQMNSMGGADASDLFASGNCAMFYSGIWRAPYFRHVKNLEWDIVLFPKGPGGIRAFMTGGSGYGICSSSRNKDDAWELVKRLALSRGEKEMAAIGLIQPALKSVAESPAFLDGKPPKNKKILLDAVKYIVFYPRMDKWEEINEGMTAPALDSVWNGKKTAAEVMPGLVRRINENYFGIN